MSIKSGFEYLKNSLIQSGVNKFKADVFLPDELYKRLSFELSQIQMNPQPIEGSFDGGIFLFDSFEVQHMRLLDGLKQLVNENDRLEKENFNLRMALIRRDK